MNKPFDPEEQWGDVEQMVRAAGGYVQPSFDLRPRVLEAARAQCVEQRARRYIRQMAVAAFFLFMTVDTSSRPQSASDENRIFSQVEVEASRGGNDVGWGVVEALTESRRRQAVLLRMAL